MRLAVTLGLGLAACSERAPRERPRADVQAVQVVDSAAAMPLVEVRAREPNDTWEVATPLAVGEQAHDAMRDASDRDLFALTIDRSRVVAVTLSALADADLVLEISDANGTVVALADSGPAGTAEGVPNLRLEPGRYALSVTEFVKKAPPPRKGARAKAPAPAPTPVPREPAQANYSLAIADVVVGLEDEREPNDAPPQAGSLGLAESKKGFVGWRGDRDVWQLATEGLGVDNVIDVQIGGVPGVTLTVDVLDADGEPVLSRRAKTAGPFFVRGLPVAAGAAWLRISGSPSNPHTSYELQFLARYAEPDVAAAPAEAEPNDRAEAATRVSEQGVLAWLDQGDVDFFAVEAAPAAMEIVVVPGELMDLALEEVAGGKVLRTANTGALGVSERLPVAAGRAATFAVRLLKRRGETTLGGDEARYRIERIEVAPTGAGALPGDDAPEPSP